MNIVIAIHSAGTMGSALSVRLREHGARVLTSLSGRSAATAERARAAGMENVFPETITTADIILSIVPPGEAVALAEGYVTRLRESHHKPVFIDCNALSPKTKTQVAVTLAGTGCDFIDGAIVGAPPQPGEKGPRLYVSGEQSDRAMVLRTLGLDLRQIDGPIGAAAALKMSYAGITKALRRLVPRCCWPPPGQVHRQNYTGSWARVCRNCFQDLRREYPTCIRKLIGGLRKCERLPPF